MWAATRLAHRDPALSSMTHQTLVRENRTRWLTLRVTGAASRYKAPGKADVLFFRRSSFQETAHGLAILSLCTEDLR